MNTTEQIYQLIQQWNSSHDAANANEALRQIALLTDCIHRVSTHLNEQEVQDIMRWLEEHHPNAYLWAISQQWIGHPAIVWGGKPALINKTTWSRS